MEHHHLHLFMEVADLLLRIAILEVGIDSAICDPLMLLMAILDEAFAHESAIVGMVVTNVDTHVLSHTLEAVLGLDSLGTGDSPL